MKDTLGAVIIDDSALMLASAEAAGQTVRSAVRTYMEINAAELPHTGGRFLGKNLGVMYPSYKCLRT